MTNKMLKPTDHSYGTSGTDGPGIGVEVIGGVIVVVVVDVVV